MSFPPLQSMRPWCPLRFVRDDSHGDVYDNYDVDDYGIMDRSFLSWLLMLCWPRNSVD